MKFSLLVLVLGFVVSTAVWARQKPADLPQCQTITSSCKAAGYLPGQHKKDGKGLWMDCVGAIAHGKTVAGVAATQDQAKACMQAFHQFRRK